MMVEEKVLEYKGDNFGKEYSCLLVIYLKENFELCWKKKFII